MVPVPRLSASRSHRYLHVLFIAFSSAFRYVLRVVVQWTSPHTQEQQYSSSSIGSSSSSGFWDGGGAAVVQHGLHKRAPEIDRHDPKFIAFVVLIPILVLLSGLFAGLTLGYMSLDETQLNVLSISGTPKQREYASKIKPIRKNGHLLLVTLLLANMIVNESLPVIADPILGGGVQSVVVSTVLIVIFSEIIPQSLFSRHGLYLGAKMARVTTILIYALGIISWPVAKFLEFALGPHHGIIYRRAELKELIAMHSNMATHGGDLKRDTVTIIGATLDLQEKVVKQAMTPIDDVFMLSIDSKLDYSLLKQICETGHSRVPVYEEIEIPIPPESPTIQNGGGALSPLATIAGVVSGAPKPERTRRVKKILGIFLVKNCVMLDPKDATPIRNMPLNKVPFVPNNEPLLGILDKFQEGRSHMAIISRFSVEKAQSVKHAVKRGLTQRLRERVGMGDTDSSSESSSSSSSSEDEEKAIGFGIRKKKKKTRFLRFQEGGSKDEESEQEKASEGSPKEGSTVLGEDGSEPSVKKKSKSKKHKSARPKSPVGPSNPLEQSMPADAVLAKEGADEFLLNFDPAVMPLGIITLEDVLEELIGEEIYDEFDVQGARGDPYQIPEKVEIDPASSMDTGALAFGHEGTTTTTKAPSHIPILKPIGLKGLGFLRPRSAPPIQKDNNIIPSGLSTKVPTMASDDNTKVDEKESPLVLPSILPSIQHSDTGTFVDLPAQQMGVEEPLAAMTMSLGRRSAPPTRAPSPFGHASAAKTTGSTTLQVPPPYHVSLPRSNSPASSLEAVLLERKRRLAAAPTTGGVGGTGVVAGGNPSVTVVPPVPSGVSTAGSLTAPRTLLTPRGTTFKSSPLTFAGGGGEGVGLLVIPAQDGTAGGASDLNDGSGNNPAAVKSHQPPGADEVYRM